MHGASNSVIHTEWPIGGRNRELDHLTEVLTSGAGAVLTGTTGIGKTRLLTELGRIALERDLNPLFINGMPTRAAIPLAAFKTALPDLPRETSPSVRLVSTIRTIADAVSSRAGHRRPVLFVDDAEFLDDTSAALVLQLVLTRRAVVLAAVGEGRVMPDSLALLIKNGLLESMRLEAITPEALADVLLYVLGAPIDPAAVLRLLEIAETDISIFHELVRTAVSERRLHDNDGIWRLDGEPSLPVSVVEQVERELADLEPAMRRALELVAFGEPLGSAELSLTDSTCIAGLERRGLLVCHVNDRRLEMRVARRVYARAVLARLSAETRLEFARELTTVLERTEARRQGDVVRQALWRLEQGTASPNLLVAAAVTARAANDFVVAERLARAAVDAGGGFTARLLAVRLAEAQGRFDDSETELAALASEAGDDAKRGQVAAARVTHLMYKLGDFEAGRKVADDALLVIADPAWRDELRALTIGPILWREGARAAADLVAPILDHSNGRAFATAALFASVSFNRLGRFNAAIDAATRGYEVQQTLDESVDFHAATHLLHHSDALANAGRIAESEALVTEAYQTALTQQDPEGQAMLALQLAKYVADRGNVTTAVDRVREATAIFRDLARLRFASAPPVYLAMALALQGDGHAAQAALSSPPTEFTEPQFSSTVELSLARAWTAVALDDMPRARGILEEETRLAQQSDDLVGESVAWHTLARLGGYRLAADRLEQLAALIEGDLATARATHARALTEADAESLEAVSLSFASMGADLLAAEAAAAAAAQWRHKKDRRRATAAERLAAVIAVRCPGARTPGLRAVGPPAELTSPEHEAATLAVQGHSNREIAQILCLSVRTVENQLQRAYVKLGVSARAQLAEAMHGAVERYRQGGGIRAGDG